VNRPVAPSPRGESYEHTPDLGGVVINRTKGDAADGSIPAERFQVNTAVAVDGQWRVRLEQIT
jgi:hypothetical protein